MRNAVVACGVATGVAALGWPRQPRVALGVVGGGVLMAVAFWAIRGVVEGVTSVGEAGENRPLSGRFPLVKFFTRHAILALMAYGMMRRLGLHPLGMLVGVSAVLAGTAVEAMGWSRPRRTR
ncbi:MAG: hypothetical protein ACT4QD_18065 [Acidobacteriota bacterium]